MSEVKQNAAVAPVSAAPLGATMSGGSGLDLKDKWRLILGKRVESDLTLNWQQEWQPSGGQGGQGGQEEQDRQGRHGGRGAGNRDGAGAGTETDGEGNEGARRRFYLRDIDESLDYIYQSDEEEIEQRRKNLGGLERPQLMAAKWLTTTKRLFPLDVYEVIQKDAIARDRLLPMLQDDEFVSRLEPNMDLLTSILAMNNHISGKALDNAKLLVEKVVEQLKNKFKMEAQRSFYGKRDLRAQPVRTFRNLDVPRIIRANLKNYQADGQYIIPRQLYFKANSIKRSLHHLFVVVDQSGSMLDSYAHASILASVFAGLPCLQTKMICYSTEIVDYTPYLDNIVELLFKSQLGGGTDTCKALTYVEKQLTEPKKTVVVLITDLYDSDPQRMIKMSAAMINSGVKFIVLPALSNEKPSYNRSAAEQYAALGASVGCMTPERLIDFVSQVVNKN